MTEQEPRSTTRTDWILIGVLIALVLPLRLWLLHNTEVTARDSIGYIRYALQFEQKDWKDVLNSNHQHPGYPMLVYLISLPIRAIDGATTPENMELSAQLVNLIASLLLLLPSYFLARQFFDRKVAFCSTLLYQLLPISAQHLSDGLSEPSFLVLLVTGLLQGVCAFRERSVWRCILCGAFTGLAYLVRPEGALILPAFAIVLIALQLRAEWRWDWRRSLSCGAAVALSAMLVGSVFVYATGKLTTKPAATEMIKTMAAAAAPEQPALAGNGHLLLFAAAVAPTDDRTLLLWHSIVAFDTEIAHGYQYVGVIPALLGFWWAIGLLKRNPGFWFLVVFGVVQGLILIKLGMTAFYVSDRHVMIFVLCGCICLVSALQELPRRLLGWLKIAQSGVGTGLAATRAEPINYSAGRKSWYRAAPVWFAILYVAFVAFCLPRATHRLHGNRAGNHAAGLWLKGQLVDGDHVDDDHNWSHYFAGLLFTEGKDPDIPTGYEPKCYIVKTCSRDPLVDSYRQAGLIRLDAKVVYIWPEQAAQEDARIIVYAQPREQSRNPWKEAKK